MKFADFHLFVLVSQIALRPVSQIAPVSQIPLRQIALSQIALKQIALSQIDLRPAGLYDIAW